MQKLLTTQSDILRYSQGLIKYTQSYNQQIKSAFPLELPDHPLCDLQLRNCYCGNATPDGRHLIPVYSVKPPLSYKLLGSCFTTKEIQELLTLEKYSNQETSN